MKYLAASQYTNEEISATIVVDQSGNCHKITTEPGEAPYIDSQREHRLRIRTQARSCSVYDIQVLPFPIFQRLCANLKQRENENDIKFTSIRGYFAEAEQEGRTISLFYGMSGSKPGNRWRCDTSWCHTHNHYTCEHVQFASRVIPPEAMINPDICEDYSDLIEA